MPQNVCKMPFKILLIYLIAINLITFLDFGIDKWKAKHGKWRTPESSLLMMAVAGGSVGAWMGMNTFRHKTKHWKFKVGIPAIMIMQLVLVTWMRLRYMM